MCMDGASSEESSDGEPVLSSFIDPDCPSGAIWVCASVHFSLTMERRLYGERR